MGGKIKLTLRFLTRTMSNIFAPGKNEGVVESPLASSTVEKLKIEAMRTLLDIGAHRSIKGAIVWMANAALVQDEETHGRIAHIVAILSMDKGRELLAGTLLQRFRLLAARGDLAHLQVLSLGDKSVTPQFVKETGVSIETDANRSKYVPILLLLYNLLSSVCHREGLLKASACDSCHSRKRLDNFRKGRSSVFRNISAVIGNLTSFGPLKAPLAIAGATRVIGWLLDPNGSRARRCWLPMKNDEVALHRAREWFSPCHETTRLFCARALNHLSLAPECRPLLVADGMLETIVHVATRRSADGLSLMRKDPPETRACLLNALLKVVAGPENKSRKNLRLFGRCGLGT